MYELKTNTAVRIAVGPLVDPTDGKTAETALTVTDLSVQIYQIKTDGSAVVRTQFTPTASGGNNDMVHVTNDTVGEYDLELTAAQLNWLGTGRICFYDVDGFLVHWIDIQIVSAAYFDWKYGTTMPDVNAAKIGNTTQTARDIGANVDAAVSSRSAAGAKMDLIDAPNATAVAAIQSGMATAANQATIMSAISGIPAAVWTVSTRTLTSFGTLVADIAAAVWAYLTSALTVTGSIGKLLTDNIDAPISEAGGAAVVIPVMTGRAYSATILQNRTVEIVQGDTPTLTFDFNTDYTGWTPYFGAKSKLADEDYAIDPKAATWTDAAEGQGYVVLTAADTATVGKFLGEIELRNGDSRHTPIKFTLIIVGAVINDSE